MENSNINDLLEEGKQRLAELQQQIEKLADTAGKVITVAGDEIINETKINVDAAKTVIESKTKEAMDSDEYRKFEADGKKAVEDAQVKIQEISVKVNELANEFGDKLRDIFGKK